jgi:hypothetical protein
MWKVKQISKHKIAANGTCYEENKQDYELKTKE